MFQKSSAILILSVCLSGVAIGAAVCIGILAYLSESEPRLFVVAAVGILGAIYGLVEAILQYEAEHKKQIVAEYNGGRWYRSFED